MVMDGLSNGRSNPWSSDRTLQEKSSDDSGFDRDSSKLKEDFDTKPNDPNDASSTVSRSEGIGPEDEIQWHYLTFESELPSPIHRAQSDGQPPACPDLKKYTNPFQWSKGRKHFMAWLGCLCTTIVAYTAGAYAAGEEQMTAEFHVSVPAFGVGIAVFTAGFAVAPMFLAPFSEINGRKPVFVVSGLFFTLFQLTCALTPNFGGMLAARFLVGCASSTFATMVGGIIGDFYQAEDRNWAMAIFAGGSTFGTGLGPICSGLIAQHLDWRW